MSVSPQDVLKFWFEDHGSKDWYGGTPEFDDKVRAAFGATLFAAEKCELFSWRETAKGRLAEIIILDQFSRQLYRKSPKAFANDALALGLAQEAVALGMDAQLNASERAFLYMPYMHSESLAIHQEAVKLFEAAQNDGNLDFELKHKKTLETFGRYPMRNEALGRTSTPEEIAYIASKKGSMF